MKYIILSDHMWSWNWVTADPNCHNYTYTFFLFSIERDIKVLGYQIFPACVVGHLNEKNWVILFVSVIFVGKLKKNEEENNMPRAEKDNESNYHQSWGSSVRRWPVNSQLFFCFFLVTEEEITHSIYI